MTTYDDDTEDFAYEIIRRYSHNGKLDPQIVKMAAGYIDGSDYTFIDMLEDNIELYDDEEVEDFVNPDRIAEIIVEQYGN